MKIDIRTGTIGPAHDPYGTEQVIVTTDGGRKISHYHDGLGCIIVRVDDTEVISSLSGGDKAVREHAAEVFHLHAGVSLDEAKHQYDAGYEPDPMGSPSMYM